MPEIIEKLIILFVYIAPYALIPLTFKFAGGMFANLAGMANDRSKGAFDRARKSRHQKYDRKVRNPMMNKRADIASKLGEKGSDSSKGRFRRSTYRALGRGVGGYNLEAQMSGRRAEVSKEINDQIATGNDAEIRGLTATHSMKKAKDNNWDGKTTTDYARVENGQRQYKTLGGAWANEAAVVAGNKRWGNDAFAQQAALSYEMRKASTNTEVQGIADNYQSWADSQGMSSNARMGAWIGAGFENAGNKLSLKHTRFNDDGSSKVKHSDLAKEIYENKGSYPLAQMHASTIDQLSAHYETLSSRDPATLSNGETETMNQIKAISETFMHEAGVSPMVGQVDDGPPITGPVVGDIQGRTRQASTPGAAHTAESVRKLAELTGVTKAPPVPPQK